MSDIIYQTVIGSLPVILEILGILLALGIIPFILRFCPRGFRVNLLFMLILSCAAFCLGFYLMFGQWQTDSAKLTLQLEKSQHCCETLTQNTKEEEKQ